MSRHTSGSGNYAKQFSIKGVDFTGMSEQDIIALYHKILREGMHGLCYSSYDEGQKPGDIITPEQIRRRLAIMKPYTNWIRTFSCIEGHEHIPVIAKEEFGMQTMVGAGLTEKPDMNEKEIQALIELAKDGYVDIAGVGNEVLLRGDLTIDEILGNIYRVKEAAPDIPVSYVDAYFEFNVYPQLVEACDIILINCYPFWEGCHIDYSLPYMQNMYYQALGAAKGKKVIISETGWPSNGTSTGDSHPGDINFMKYFINAQLWARAADVEMMYFASFDESWKVGPEGDVGAHWGIWDKYENLKYSKSTKPLQAV